ncbi:MAG: S26 family signal peptidase [Geodermatophilaceae bacterium]|nr:S26 family signal peptidase [Geodermatophilaceae bacterium]
MSRSGSIAGTGAADELPWLMLVTVRGPSMVPTLQHGDRLLAKRHGGLRIRPGAVVLVGWQGRPGLLAVKRVVRRVPGGHWVEGDNPSASDDSRSYGPATVRAVVLGRCWPWPPCVRATLRR